MTEGVVRLGDTVRRPATANSHFVRWLLTHLAERGFDGAPRFLGTDDAGRDMLSFNAGDVPADLALHSDATLRHAATLIRRYHDATTELAASSSATADGSDVICHNDLSPCNFVFRDGIPVAIIDFDAAALGSRAHDLGYAAWLWLDIGTEEIAAAEQGRRLALLLGAYGPIDGTAVLGAMLDRQRRLASEGQRIGDRALAEWAEACREWTRSNLAALRDG